MSPTAVLACASFALTYIHRYIHKRRCHGEPVRRSFKHRRKTRPPRPSVAGMPRHLGPPPSAPGTQDPEPGTRNSGIRKPEPNPGPGTREPGAGTGSDSRLTTTAATQQETTGCGSSSSNNNYNAGTGATRTWNRGREPGPRNPGSTRNPDPEPATQNREPRIRDPGPGLDDIALEGGQQGTRGHGTAGQSQLMLLHVPTWRSRSACIGDLVKMAATQARKVLCEAGMLPLRADLICCWQFGSRMQSASSSSTGDGKDGPQCPDCVFRGRHRLQLRHAPLPWSVVWTGAMRGYGPSLLRFLEVLLFESAPPQNKPIPPWIPGNMTVCCEACFVPEYVHVPV